MNLSFRYLVTILAVTSFAVGIVASPTVSAAIQSLGMEQIRTDEMKKFNIEIGEEIKKLSNEIQAIKNKPEAEQPETSEEIMNLERQIQILDMRIDRIINLSEDIDELREEIARLKTSPQLQSLSASLDKAEYRAGDPLVVSGVGLSNRSVKIALLDSDRVTISEGITVSDSAGKFTFTVQLSRNLSDGSYVITASQESNIIEKAFRIVSVPIQNEGFTLTTDSREYLRGENVLFRGITEPNTWIDLDIFDSRDVQTVRTSTKSDATGRYSLAYTIASNAPLGEYEAKATVGSKQASTKFSVVLTKTFSSPSSDLTVETDRSTYNRGDFVTVRGKGIAYEKVTITVEPKSGDKLILTVNADSSGNYRTIFSIKQSAFGGQWKLTAKQGIDTATTSITVI